MRHTFEPLESRQLMSANLVADIGGLLPHDTVTLANGKSFFEANDGKHGFGLWVSDGSVAGTHMVKQFPKGSMAFHSIVADGDSVAFIANTTDQPQALWRSDGTAAGTVNLGTIRLGHDWYSDWNSIAAVNGKITFLARVNDGVSHGTIDLWENDGTPGSLHKIAEITGVSYQDVDGPRPTLVNGRLIYGANSNSLSDNDVWSTDGTAAGTIKVSTAHAASIGQLVPGGAFYFWQSGVGLTKTDGTLAGTEVISSQVTANIPNPSIVTGGKIYYPVQTIMNGNTVVATDVWESDGTAAGTHASFALPGLLWSAAAAGNKLIVSATAVTYDTHPDHSGDSVPHLYSIDLTTKQQVELPATSAAYHLTSAGGHVYFGIGLPRVGDFGNTAIWRTDGSVAGTVQVGTFLDAYKMDADGDRLIVSTDTEYAGSLQTPKIFSAAEPQGVLARSEKSVSLVHGVLRVFGTRDNDNIRLYPLDADPSRLVVALNDVKHSFAMSDVTRIEIYGYEGNDQIATLEKHNRMSIRTRIDGGTGNDTIFTGSARDTIIGGFGNDSISGGTNADLIDGGDGNDSILCGPGDDTATGGDGVDSIQGNSGADQLSGGDDDSKDHVEGDDGADVLFGSSAIDVFFNGAGKLDPLDTILS